mgnify:CR=1 FL=1
MKLFFQPDEEGDGGAERMIAAGCMENPAVDAMLCCHVESGIPAGTAHGAQDAREHGLLRQHVPGGAAVEAAHGDHRRLGGVGAAAGDGLEGSDQLGAAAEILGPENVLEMGEPSLGADDFGYFANLVPSCY